MAEPILKMTSESLTRAVILLIPLAVQVTPTAFPLKGNVFRVKWNAFRLRRNTFPLVPFAFPLVPLAFPLKKKPFRVKGNVVCLTKIMFRFVPNPDRFVRHSKGFVSGS